MKIKLSIRMQMNATLVPDGARVVDIGCDHGYVAMWLAKEKKCPVVIASDVNAGPLKRAEKNIKEAKLDHLIETRLSDGFSAITPGEVDTAVIAGMGGMLMCEILSGGMNVIKEMNCLVLQPQSDIGAVRRHIHRIGWHIDKESICLEDGKYYFSIRALPGEEETPYSDAEYEHSRYLSDEGSRVYINYTKSEIKKYEDILMCALNIAPEFETEELKQRKEEILKKVDEFKKMINKL